MNINVDSNTIKDRESLDQMVKKLFDLWGLSPADRVELSAGDDDQEVCERVRLLLLIHESLRILFPHNPDLCYAWINKHSDVFAGLTPLEIMLKEGLVRIAGVARYLEWNAER